MTTDLLPVAPRLGVDIGRVIIDGDHHPSGDDTAFLKGGTEEMLRTPPVDGALDTLARLVRLFGGRVWLVSKCGPRVQDRTRQWLVHHRVHQHTGIPPSHLRFCLRRADKALHCAELAISHFVDDRVDVLVALAGIVPHRYLFGPYGIPQLPPGIQPTPTWADVETAILAALDQAPGPSCSTAGGSRRPPSGEVG
jgi:hypothetical protein